jgi:hypothetical protein
MIIGCCDVERYMLSNFNVLLYFNAVVHCYVEHVLQREVFGSNNAASLLTSSAFTFHWK